MGERALDSRLWGVLGFIKYSGIPGGVRHPNLSALLYTQIPTSAANAQNRGEKTPALAAASAREPLGWGGLLMES